MIMMNIVFIWPVVNVFINSSQPDQFLKSALLEIDSVLTGSTLPASVRKKVFEAKMIRVFNNYSQSQLLTIITIVA